MTHRFVVRTLDRTTDPTALPEDGVTMQKNLCLPRGLCNVCGVNPRRPRRKCQKHARPGTCTPCYRIWDALQHRRLRARARGETVSLNIPKEEVLHELRVRRLARAFDILSRKGVFLPTVEEIIAYAARIEAGERAAALRRVAI